MLLGRTREREALRGLLDTARSGRSGALVVRGEAGIGKTALLDFAVDTAPDFAMVRASGVESEMELPLATLHQLCGRMADGLERLPGPQAVALAVAFGLRPGGPPDRFLVGLGVLGLLSQLTEDQPLLCVVDDGQWLDRASVQTLGFVARRLDVQPVALVLGVRDDDVRELGQAPLVLAAWHGDERRAGGSIASLVGDATTRGEGGAGHPRSGGSTACTFPNGCSTCSSQRVPCSPAGWPRTR